MLCYSILYINTKILFIYFFLVHFTTEYIIVTTKEIRIEMHNERHSPSAQLMIQSS